MMHPPKCSMGLAFFFYILLLCLSVSAHASVISRHHSPYLEFLHEDSNPRMFSTLPSRSPWCGCRRYPLAPFRADEGPQRSSCSSQFGIQVDLRHLCSATLTASTTCSRSRLCGSPLGAIKRMQGGGRNVALRDDRTMTCVRCKIRVCCVNPFSTQAL